MTIEKNSFKVARFETEDNRPRSRDTHMSSDDEDSQRRNTISAVESDDDEFDDCDSGAGSDDFDLLELGETGEEFCQVGNQTCSIPYELYDLPGLKDVLSMEVWNEVLTEEERFGLSKYLPDMDQENFVRTMKELFSGDNLHFGSPVDKLFEMLKGGLCEPRVALYRQGLNFFQRRQHYHNLRKHQNAMVSNLCQIRDAWLNCRGYSIDEKLRVLNIMNSQKSLMNENREEFGTESSEREEPNDGLWSKRAKDRKLGQKASRYSMYGVGPAVDNSSHDQKITMKSSKYGKQNSKGTLKLAGKKTKELAEPFPSIHHGVEIRSGCHVGPSVSRHSKALGYGSPAAVRMNEQIFDDDDDEAETMYEVAVHRDRSFPRVGANARPGASNWRKYGGPRSEEDMDSFTGIPFPARNDLHAHGRNKGINNLSDIKVLTANPSNAKSTHEGGKKVKHTGNYQQFSGENQMKFGKGQKSNLFLKGSQIEVFDGNDPAWHGAQGGLFPGDLNARNKKWKMGRQAVDLNANDKVLREYRVKPLQDKFHAGSLQNGRGFGTARREDTESDSSEQMNEDDNPLIRSKWAYPSGVPDAKKPEISKRNKKENYVTLDGSSHYTENLEMMKSNQKGKMHDVGYFNNFPTKNLDKNSSPGLGNVNGNDEGQQFYPLGRNGHVEGNYGNSFHMPSLKSSLQDRRRKGEIRRDFGLPQSNHMHDSNLEDDLFWTRPLTSSHHPERSDIPLIGCNTFSKKRKVKDDLTRMDQPDNNDYLHADTEFQHNDVSSSRKRGKNKLEETSDVLDDRISEPPVMELEIEDVEAETKRQKKPFPLITPTVHTGFSFSIIHLLSAVRMAMITLLPEDSGEAGKQIENADPEKGVKEEQDSKHGDPNLVNSNPNTSMPTNQANVPCLTVQDIINRVRSNPGDPCILETQEPLQDLIRGVLKIFCSRTAPLGAKGWKPLVVYEKSTKSWSWIGPLPHNLSDSDVIEEVTSPDAWCLPHKMLVKLVDSFANWLKNSQDTLQQIGSLPAPPLTLMQINLDEKERFKDLRAQKSLSTISPSSEEVKAYFRQEEMLRYLIPDRAFSYTAVDGKKSIVAPLRRCGGKPTSKARDHFMLKRNRPPHVTILCLVRDAAARLPGSIGTRADVCTLIRDSQYIVEDVSDAQVNQVVSGALDRLHYERDPCVQFDGERKLWVYLHREREEEDFEDDGTSSTKKWRRQKKEANEPSEQGDVTVAYAGPTGDLVSDPNVEASCADNYKRSEHDYHNGNDLVEDNAENSRGSDNELTPAVWNGVGLKSVEENKFCQENSTNEDLDEDAFDGEPPA